MAARFATVTEEEIGQMNETFLKKVLSTCLVNTKTIPSVLVPSDLDINH